MPTLLDILEAHQKNKKDKRVFGLVLPGGGMRGVYTAGAATVLLHYGLQQAFDHVVGVSAGALNGAYFLSEDAETLSHTFQDDLTNKNFVNLLRKDKPIDIDYLIDMVMKHKRPYDIEKLKKQKTKLHIMLTDAKTGKSVIDSSHDTLEEIYEEFRATAALPFVYGKQIPIDGHYYIDGGVADNLPIDVAVKLGCTDIVVILTQQLSAYHFGKRHQRLMNQLVRRYARNYELLLRKKLLTDERLLQANLRVMQHPTKKVRFYILEPSDEEALVSLGSIDKPKVERLGKIGVADMDTFLHTEVKQ